MFEKSMEINKNDFASPINLGNLYKNVGDNQKAYE